MQERLQKLIAQAGIASRRKAEELIADGEVTVNGAVVTELGTKADPEVDHIKVHGKLINTKLEQRENVYILLNKPKGYLSSAADPENRKLVVDLVKGFGKLHPVGRLDFNTEGLIMLTNDGDFTNFIANSKTVPKVYEVKTKGLPTEVALNKLRRGTLLPDGFKTAPAEIKVLKPTENNGWYEVTLFEGHNQQIRKMFDSIGHSVVKLKRVRIGHIADDYLKPGDYRKLSEAEIKQFKNPPPIKKVVKPIAKSAAPKEKKVAVPRPKPKRSGLKAARNQQFENSERKTKR